MLALVLEQSNSLGDLALKRALVTDSDLGLHDAINARAAPLYGEVFLPPNFTLLYASGDKGNEATNRILAFCDKQAKTTLRAMLAGDAPTPDRRGRVCRDTPQILGGSFCQGELGTDLVDGLAALQKEQPSALSTDALFSTSSNIRFNDVISVMDAMEVMEPRAWIAAYQPLADHCDAQQVTAEAFLKDLVDRRNEAAHGNKLPDDFWSVSVLKNAGNFILKFAAAMATLIAARIAENGSAPNVVKIGTVSEVFAQANAIVAKTAGGGSGPE